jgi:hypothetical protein
LKFPKDRMNEHCAAISTKYQLSRGRTSQECAEMHLCLTAHDRQRQLAGGLEADGGASS